MISKGEAIARLKKMGVSVADDQSIVTILLPENVSFLAGIKDIKEKMKSMDYNASFCVRQKKDLKIGEETDLHSVTEEAGMEVDGEVQSETENMEEKDEILQEEVTDDELKGSLLSMDEDGQFTLGGFGMDF